MFLQFVITLALVMLPYLPSPKDLDGLGLRIRLCRDGPLLQCESIGSVAFDVLLINFSKRDREHDPLVVALDTGDLGLRIAGPDGNYLGAMGGPNLERDPFTVKNKLRAGELASDRFGFGYHTIVKKGQYRATAKLEIDGKELSSPTIEFSVVEVQNDAIFASHALTRTDRKPLPGEKQERSAVEQIHIGNQVWLVYRRWGSLGNGPIFARRLAVLPDKCDMAVKGAFATGNPITISYKDASSKTGWTTLVINSIDGMPWTEEEERLRIERTKKAPPAPRPVRP